MINKWFACCLTILVLLLSACSSNSNGTKQSANSNRDTLLCWADASLRVITQEQIKSFENIYNFPRFKTTYLNEDSIINGLLNNTVSIAVLHRMLSENEVKVLNQRESFIPKQYVFAYDAYAFIASDAASFQSLNVDQIQQYFNSDGLQPFSLCIENSNAQSKTYLKNKYNLSGAQLSKIYATKSLNELMQYVRQSPNAIAMVPFSYISDIESDSIAALLNNVKVLPVAFKDSTGKAMVSLPTQSSISTKEYPMISPVVFVNCNMEKKSGTNFVNFLFKTKAQRLILKCGLVPAIFPGREVIIKP